VLFSLGCGAASILTNCGCEGNRGAIVNDRVMTNRNAFAVYFVTISTRLACYEMGQNRGKRNAFCDTESDSFTTEKRQKAKLSNRKGAEGAKERQKEGNRKGCLANFSQPYGFTA
jgi:hypothetical protein